MSRFKCMVIFLMIISNIVGYNVQMFETWKFKVGVEYDKSLPMSAGSDRYRHRNNYDPFFVTVTASAKNGYVISYLEVMATTDIEGQAEFCLIRGQTGTRSMVFQLISNQSDFLSYSYTAYGIREEEYKKITNIITLPLHNDGTRIRIGLYTYVIFLAFLFIYDKIF